MLETNQRVLSTICEWLEQRQSLWLCTIVATYGSSPRPVGSLMAVSEEGVVVGSISGGCIEEDLIEQLSSGRLAEEFGERSVTLVTYGITQQEQIRLKLPCGGQLKVLLEWVQPDSEQARHLLTVAQHINQNRKLVRNIELKSHRCRIEFDEWLVAELNETNVCYGLGPDYRLLIIGAGEIAYHLSELALASNFIVVVCDPREDFRRGWYCEGAQLKSEFPDDLIRDDMHDSHCAIVAVSHDPRVDDMALMEALRTDAFYVGAMGSMKTSQGRRDRLQMLDLNAAQIQRLHAPIGLPIGSKTPAEIAISIMAHIIQIKYQS